MSVTSNWRSLVGGIASTALGVLLISPLVYRRESIEWDDLFSYVILVTGVFLLIVGLKAIAKRSDNGPQKDTPLHFWSADSGPQNYPDEIETKEEIASQRTNPLRSNYYFIAAVIGLSPLLPLVLFVVLNITCSSFGTGLGFACQNTGPGHSIWREVFAYYGILGWFLSLPAWALLAFAGMLLKIR